MQELIERLEKATGPDRELDLAILNAGAPAPWVWLDRDRETVTSNKYGEGAVGNPVVSLERFTERLDDALELVPGGYALDVSFYTSGSGDARLWQGDRHVGPYGASTWLRDIRPASPAIAVCIAALLARAALSAAQR